MTPVQMILPLLFSMSFLMVSGEEKFPLPPRPDDALTGSAFVETIKTLPLTEREEAIYAQVAIGNIPDFMREFCEITVTKNISGKDYTAKYEVSPDYFCIGSDEDYFLCPMTPTLAQRIADLMECSLPTRKMVNDIYSQSGLKLAPAPIPPSGEMTTVPVFAQHNGMVWAQRSTKLGTHPLGTLVGGTKKDVVVSNKLATAPPPPRVAIYGWHQLNGLPIQPLYTGHGDFYADYSHGIRLVRLAMTVDGEKKTVPEILAHPQGYVLLSDEGTIAVPRYPVP